MFFCQFNSPFARAIAWALFSSQQTLLWVAFFCACQRSYLVALILLQTSCFGRVSTTVRSISHFFAWLPVLFVNSRFCAFADRTAFQKYILSPGPVRANERWCPNFFFATVLAAHNMHSSISLSNLLNQARFNSESAYLAKSLTSVSTLPSKFFSLASYLNFLTNFSALSACSIANSLAGFRTGLLILPWNRRLSSQSMYSITWSELSVYARVIPAYLSFWSLARLLSPPG